MEDWVETRRLHRAEGVSISEIARRMGLVGAEHGEGGAALGAAAEIRAGAARIVGGRGGARGTRVTGGVSPDARDGDS